MQLIVINALKIGICYKGRISLASSQFILPTYYCVRNSAMYLYHSSPHHRRSDTDQHDFVTLLIEIVSLIIIILLWPAT